MQKPSLNRDLCLALIAGFLCAMTLFLLLTPNYFSLKDLQNSHISLQGITIESDFYEYSEISNSCQNYNSTLYEYCDKIPDLAEGGEILMSMLVIDMIVLSLFVFETIFLNMILKGLVSQVLLQKEISKLNRCLSKVCSSGKVIIYLHPVLLILGVILWVSIGNLDSFANSLQIEEGIIILIIQSFLSLFLVAFYSWSLSATKRHNLRLILKQDQKYVEEEKTPDLTLSM